MVGLLNSINLKSVSSPGRNSFVAQEIIIKENYIHHIQNILTKP